MSFFGYRRELSKYEDVDEDELLASLSPEELAELEKELVDIDPDANVPIGLRQRDQTDKTPTGTFSREALMKYWENETRKLLENEIGETGCILKELKNALRPVSAERRAEEGGSRPSTPMRSAHDQLMESIRSSSLRNLRRVRGRRGIMRKDTTSPFGGGGVGGGGFGCEKQKRTNSPKGKLHKKGV
uniref:WH2 domain-containing protein n=1 Tax=Poecilia latipinna TaxID=48699 RepID=A0A3B3TGU0_9TELE